MSAGISSLSNDELMQQLSAARSGASAGTASGLSGLSDAELMRQLGAVRSVPAGQAVKNPPSTSANPFSRGDDPASFEDRFGSTPMARDTGASGPLHDALQARADERLIGPSGIGNQTETAASTFSNTLGLNLPRNAAAGIATAAGALGVPGYSNKSFDENYQLAKDRDDALSRQNRAASIGGTVAGIGASMVALPAWGGASSMGGRAFQAGVTGAGYGAASEYADTKDLGDAAKAGGIGFGLGTVATPLAEYAVKGAQVLAPWVAKNIPFRNGNGQITDEARAALQRAGVNPDTLGRGQLEEAVRQTFGQKGISEATAREAGAAEFNIPLTRGQATQDPRQLALEQRLAGGNRGERAREAAGGFFDQQRTAIDTARGNIGTELAGPGNRVSSPLEAGEMVANRARQIADEAAQAEQGAQRSADTALSGVRGDAPVDALDAGAVVAQGVRDRATQAKAGYRAAYQDVADMPGQFAPGALDRMGSRVRDRLGPEYPVDPVLTPASSRAMADLDKLPELLGTADGSGPTAAQVDQARKRLVNYYGSTGQNATDRRALGRILNEFDNHIEDAMGAGLFGDAASFAPGSRAGSPVAGAAASDVASGLGGAGASERAPETLTQFLARQGGIALDGDARAGDLQRIMTGTGPLARRNGRSLDELRVPLMEEGFIPPDPDGGMARNITDEVYRLLRREREGVPTYREADRARAATLDQGGRAADDAANYAERVGHYTNEVAADLKAAGLIDRDLDPTTLRHAGESLMLGEHPDAFAAYEAAAMRPGASSGRSAAVDVPFPGEGGASVATSDALPGGTLAPAEAMKRARAAFSDYKNTFSPQGAGDDVGAAMRRIVDRDAQPQEVSNFLYGASKVGNTGLSTRLATRMKSVLGEDSPEWGAVQQGLISRVLGGDATREKLAERVSHILDGDGRNLARSVLTDAQMQGLRDFRTHVQFAGKARDAVPSWVGDLARHDFNPNAIVDDLFGRAAIGQGNKGVLLARGVKGTFGEASPEWGALRQALWQKVSSAPEGAESFGPKELTQRINDLVSGRGKPLAAQFFSPEEIAQMQRFSAQVALATPPAVTRGVPKERVLMKVLAEKAPALALNTILGGLGFAAAGPAGAASAIGANLGRKLAEGALGVAKVRQFSKGAPNVPLPAPDLRELGIAGGDLAAQTY